MQLSFSKQDNVTVLHVMGDVDSSNYTEVIIKAQQLYDDGTRNLLLDLANVPYVSSAGLGFPHHCACLCWTFHSRRGKWQTYLPFDQPEG